MLVYVFTIYVYECVMYMFLFLDCTWQLAISCVMYLMWACYLVQVKWFMYLLFMYMGELCTCFHFLIAHGMYLYFFSVVCLYTLMWINTEV